MLDNNVLVFLSSLTETMSSIHTDMNQELSCFERDIKTDIELIAEAVSDIRKFAILAEDRLSILQDDFREF